MDAEAPPAFREAHPGVIEPGYGPTADDESAEIASQYVQEFVAQSEVYPLDGS